MRSSIFLEKKKIEVMVQQLMFDGTTHTLISKKLLEPKFTLKRDASMYYY